MARAVSLLINLLNNMPFRDNRGQTPYIVAPDKDTRNVFRKYMGENPDRYDYKKAQVKSKLIACISLNINAYCCFFLTKTFSFGSWKVPGPLTEEIESKQLEKKKAQNALKKQREKKQREEKRQQELEAEEKRRFASLSDREKVSYASFSGFKFFIPTFLRQTFLFFKLESSGCREEVGTASSFSRSQPLKYQVSAACPQRHY